MSLSVSFHKLVSLWTISIWTPFFRELLTLSCNMKIFPEAAEAATVREIWVAHPTRGVSTWLLASFVVLLAVTCVNSSPTIECPLDVEDDTDIGASTTSVSLPLPTAEGTGVIIQCDSEGQSTFSIGTTAITCTATYGDGNKATCVYYVIITDDEKPTITNVPADVRVTISLADLEFSNARAVATWQAPATVDNSNLVTLSSSHQSGETFPVGDTTVTYTATDRAGNTVDESFHVKVFVKPPDDDLFVERLRIENNEACLTLVWPETGDQETDSYGLFFWKEGDPRPPSEQRKTQDADRDETYVKYDQCGLLPGELYNVAVQKEPASMDVGRLQFWTKPNQVQFLTPEASVNASFDVSWELSSDNVDQYLLDKNIGNERSYEYLTKTTDHARIEGCQPGKRNMFHISALVGSSDMRQGGAVSSLTLHTASPRVDELIVYNYTESTIAVAWEAADDNNQQLLSSSEPFMVFIYPEGTDESFQIIPARPLVAEFTGLKPNTNYEIKLIHNVMQMSLTTTQKTRPMRATNVRPTDVQSSSITLEWEQSIEGVTYELYISPGDESDPITVTQTSHTFPQLKNNTEYFIKIVSVYGGMKSVPQTLLVTTGVTKPTHPPSDIITVVVVATVLGCIVLVLAFVILIACIKLRRLQKNPSQQGAAKAGHTNKAIDMHGPRPRANRGKQYQEDYGGEYAVPGDPGVATDKKPSHEYQNAKAIKLRAK